MNSVSAHFKSQLTSKKRAVSQAVWLGEHCLLSVLGFLR